MAGHAVRSCRRGSPVQAPADDARSLYFFARDLFPLGQDHRRDLPGRGGRTQLIEVAWIFRLGGLLHLEEVHIVYLSPIGTDDTFAVQPSSVGISFILAATARPSEADPNTSTACRCYRLSVVSCSSGENDRAPAHCGDSPRDIIYSTGTGSVRSSQPALHEKPPDQDRHRGSRPGDRRARLGAAEPALLFLGATGSFRCRANGRLSRRQRPPAGGWRGGPGAALRDQQARAGGGPTILVRAPLRSAAGVAPLVTPGGG